MKGGSISLATVDLRNRRSESNSVSAPRAILVSRFEDQMGPPINAYSPHIEMTLAVLERTRVSDISILGRRFLIDTCGRRRRVDTNQTALSCIF